MSLSRPEISLEGYFQNKAKNEKGGSLISVQRKHKPFAAFLWQKQAQRKANKRNADKEVSLTAVSAEDSVFRNCKPFEKGLT